MIYIAGLGHSGSTLLGALLGQLERFFYAGELTSTARALSEESVCGCGESISACPVWSRILTSLDEPGAVDRLALDPFVGRARGAVRQLLPPSRDLMQRRTAFAGLFTGIAEMTESRVIVDSSAARSPR